MLSNGMLFMVETGSRVLGGRRNALQKNALSAVHEATHTQNNTPTHTHAHLGCCFCHVGKVSVLEVQRCPEFVFEEKRKHGTPAQIEECL